MAAFRESRTAQNLLIAYSAEAQARTRYDFFARRAKDDGYLQISKIFTETADQEYEHALRFFKFFNGGTLEISWPFPAGVIEDTHANLCSSAELERYVHEEMYQQFAIIAEQEGYRRAADTFEAISNSERQHETTFRQLAHNIVQEEVFSKQTSADWRCLACGYIHHGKVAPEKCPACVRPQGYFELFAPSY